MSDNTNIKLCKLAEIEHQIREFINDRRVQHALLQDTAAWTYCVAV
jgi:hypothetical protein